MLKDKDIREPLFFFLEEEYGKVRILEEKNIGRSRADAVMVTEDAIFGIEIKSDADTYARLSRQVSDYDKYYDKNIVVVGSTHAMHISEHVPEHWGIITVEEEDGKPDLYYLRRPKDNAGVTMRRKLEFLWRPELVKIQEKHDMPAYREKSRSFVADKIASRCEDGTIPASALQEEIIELLFERDYNTIFEEINEYRRSRGVHKRRRRAVNKKRSK
ncbi:MAG: sce7726 family protein [Lachnospiraceae bacterium]|nr:sce7726 family protein [Lachnospiraceae bacterium]